MLYKAQIAERELNTAARTLQRTGR
jgi:hypothetical protein